MFRHMVNSFFIDFKKSSFDEIENRLSLFPHIPPKVDFLLKLTRNQLRIIYFVEYIQQHNHLTNILRKGYDPNGVEFGLN